jgi:integrase/recombinase XerD
MAEHNPNNERIKRQYYIYLKDAKRHGEATVDAVAKALFQFEADTRFRDFKNFHFSKQAPSKTA